MSLEPRSLETSLIRNLSIRLARHSSRLYPEPNVAPDQYGLNNFRTSVLTNAPSHQFDIKIDHNFTDTQKFSGRFSHLYSEYNVPFVLANADFNDGFNSDTSVYNIGLEYDWTIKPTLVWTNRFAVDRVSAPVESNFPSLSSVGFPSSLARERARAYAYDRAR